MDVKKKTFLENLRQKTKLVNLKKQKKKPLEKQGRRLAHRRSISVPDLRFVPGEAFSTENALMSVASEAIFFGVSPGVSDTDSVASGCIADGPLFSDKLSDSVSYQTDQATPALNRMSTPAESLLSYEEIEEMINSGEQRVSESKVNLAPEGLYARVDKKAKGNVPKFTFEPVPAPRSVFTNPPVLSPRPDLEERESLYGGDPPADPPRVHSGSVSAVLARASSLGDQVNIYTEKRTPTFEQKRPSSEKGTPPIIKKAPADRVSLILDTSGIPSESADGISLDSACGTPIDERVSMPWTTDSEELDREPCSPLLMRDFSSEEVLQDVVQSEEALEEVSIITNVLKYKSCLDFQAAWAT